MIEWKNKHYSYFQNLECEYFPCHNNIDRDNFNCIFCYCPLYDREDCGGNYLLLDNNIKDCSICTLCHDKNNYGKILNKLIGETKYEE